MLPGIVPIGRRRKVSSEYLLFIGAQNPADSGLYWFPSMSPGPSITMPGGGSGQYFFSGASTTGSRLGIGTNNGYAIAYDTSDWSALSLSPVTGGSYRKSTFTHDDTYFNVGTDVYAYPSLTRVYNSLGTYGVIRPEKLSPADDYYVALQDRGSLGIRIVEIPSGDVIVTPSSQPPSSPFGADWNANSGMLAVSCADSPGIQMWTETTWDTVPLGGSPFIAAVDTVRFSPDGTRLAVRPRESPHLRVYEQDTGWAPAEPDESIGSGQSCDWTPDGKWLLAYGNSLIHAFQVPDFSVPAFSVSYPVTAWSISVIKGG